MVSPSQVQDLMGKIESSSATDAEKEEIVNKVSQFVIPDTLPYRMLILALTVSLILLISGSLIVVLLAMWKDKEVPNWAETAILPVITLLVGIVSGILVPSNRSA